jgi:hypothetical protein
MTSPQPAPHFTHVGDFPDGARHYIADVTYSDSTNANALLEQLLHDKDAGRLIGAAPGQLVAFVLLYTTDPAFAGTPHELHAIVIDPVEDDGDMSVGDYIEAVLEAVPKPRGSLQESNAARGRWGVEPQVSQSPLITILSRWGR